MPARDKPSFACAVALSLALLLIVLAFFHTYYIGGSGDGDLLWNTNEAYLFVRGERRGYHVSYLGYVPEVVKEYFGVFDSPDDRNPFTLIIRITSSGIQRYEEKQIFDFLTPLDHGLYAWGPDRVLWKWVEPTLKRQAQKNGNNSAVRRAFRRKTSPTRVAGQHDIR